jgi:hypothetical protein
MVCISSSSAGDEIRGMILMCMRTRSHMSPWNNQLVGLSGKCILKDLDRDLFAYSLKSIDGCRIGRYLRQRP